MQIDPERFLRHVRACTNATLPGRRVALRIGGASVGWVLPADAPRGVLADRAAFDDYVRRLAGDGGFQPRGELFDVRGEATGAVVATVDRGALPVLGIAARGVHVNGLVQRADGLHLWVGRRAADKQLDPGKLDHLTAGGIAAGDNVWSTLVKEAGEEASVPVALARTAQPAGVLRYAMDRAEGLRRDRLYCFDLYLPEDFVPCPGDGEVVGFTLCKLADVLEQVAATDAFKFNVNLVLIDLFVRTGLIAAGGVVDAAVSLLRARQHAAAATG